MAKMSKKMPLKVFAAKYRFNPKEEQWILDNDKDKQDKRLYGTDFIVKNPDVIYNYSNPTVIVRAGVYSEEIKSQLLNINPTTKFL